MDPLKAFQFSFLHQVLGKRIVLQVLTQTMEKVDDPYILIPILSLKHPPMSKAKMEANPILMRMD